MRSPFRILIALPAFLFMILAATSSSENSEPLVSLDLRSLGYLPPVAARDMRALSFLDAPVAFLDNETLAVSFLVANEHPGFSTRDTPMGSPILFHTVLLDPLNAHVYQQRSWGNASNWMGFLPLDNSKFFVQDADHIAIYSKDLHQLATGKISMPGDIFPRFAVSSSGHALFAFWDFYDAKNSWLTRVDFLDPADLTLRRSTITTGHKFETVSDAQVVYAITMTPGPLRLLVHNTDGTSRSKTHDLFDPALITAKTIARSHCSTAAFVSNSILAISGDCGSLLLTRSGEIFQEINAPEFQFGSDIRSSRDGTRFAFARSKARAHSEKISNIELCVYGISRHKVIFTFPVSPLPQHKLGFALSPDGSLLALQSDNLLRVWSLSMSN
jgi:hypothetical protein